MWQNSPRPRETMSAKAASFLANRGAPAISRRIERVSARAAATGDAGYASRRGRRETLAGSLLGVGTSFCFPARADESSGTSPVSAPDAAPRRPAACATGTSCVSTSSFRTPANYLPPWEYVEDDAVAFAKLERALRGRAVADSVRADAAAGFVAASLAYPDGVDDYEFYFKNDGSKTVLFKAQSRVNKASPPGCFTPGCINGPRNRSRVEELRRDVGWLAFETDEDKKWVPLLLH